MSGIEFLKGHGTQNDFVVLPDPEARLALGTEFVAALCDRQRGLGADGVLRVATAGALQSTGVLTKLPAGVTAADWFMDYRNADGSIAEMCGNGVRVFAHYLRDAGLVAGQKFTVGSRAGARPVVVHHADSSHADVSVEMGPVRLGAHSKVRLSEHSFGGVAVDVGNPHLACVVPDLTDADLGSIDLTVAPDIDAELFPDGANIEIIVARGAGTVRMRVLERGVGETRSCGTGTVAAAAAALVAEDKNTGAVTVLVPGGAVEVQIRGDGSVLRGPSELVARGTLSEAWN